MFYIDLLYKVNLTSVKAVQYSILLFPLFIYLSKYLISNYDGEQYSVAHNLILL